MKMCNSVKILCNEVNRIKNDCVILECAMRKMKISTKKWKDCGKGRGFGYVSVRVTKYACDYRRLKGFEDLTRLRDYKSDT